MESIELKKVSFNEIEKLQVISRQTFAEAFSSDNSAEDMKEYLGKELFCHIPIKQFNNKTM